MKYSFLFLYIKKLENILKKYGKIKLKVLETENGYQSKKNKFKLYTYIMYKNEEKSIW